MKSNSARFKRNAIVTSAITAAVICLLPLTPAFATDSIAPVGANAALPSTQTDVAGATAALAATPWVTSAATDQNGTPVALNDPRAANFVGNAYFKTDGTYTMFNLDDTPKMTGNWEMRLTNGQLVRWINAKNEAGDILFQREVPIVQLDHETFTYRVINSEDPTQWVDIIHTPTNHTEPGTGGADEDSEPPAKGEGSESGTHPSTGGDVRPELDDAAQRAQQLATTGGAGPIMGIVASVLALAGGATLFAARAVRRH